VTQKFVGAHWENVTPFAQTSVDRFHDLEMSCRISSRMLATMSKTLMKYCSSARALDAARKLIVEYWADGPASELPPGHGGLLAQFCLAARPALHR